MTSFTIPDSVQYIQARAFFNCDKLSSIKFGKAVLTIASDALGTTVGGSTLFYNEAGTEIYPASQSVEFAGKEFTGTIAEMTREPGDYAVTFADGLIVKNGGTAITSGDTVRYGTELTVEAEAKTGCTAEILLNDTMEITGGKFTVGMTNVLTLIWTVNKHNVTFVSDGETLKEVIYAYGATIEKPEDPTKTGYTFDCWKMDDTPFDFGKATMPDNDITLTAAWAVNEHKVTFVSDGKTLKEVTYAYGATIEKPEDPTKTGYTFDCWKMDDTPFDFGKATMPDNDITLTAAWAVNEHKVTFVSDGKTLKEVTYAYGATIEKPEDPTKTGYTFDCWKMDDTPFDFGKATMPDNDITLTAAWAVNEHKVTFVSDGKTLKEVTYAYGATIEKPEDPTKTGYTFDCWKMDDTPFDFGKATMPDNDIVLTAVWELSPIWEDDEPCISVPIGGNDSSSAESESSVAAVAVAAGCAVVLSVILAMLGNGRFRS